LDKAPDAFRTISEVADDLDLPQHVLRFWETRFQQIKPMKRGGGRRYYRPDDVDLLRGIRHLLYGEGYTIRGVQRMLKDHGIKFVQNVWKSDAPQPAQDEEESEALARPPPRGAPRAEEGAHRRLFGLLPSFLASDREADAERIEPPGAARAPAAEPEPEETPGPMHVAAAPAPMHATVVPARALPGDHVAKLRGMLHELQECRRLLDAAIART
jgi:DNA-binding transcriptional MerR regulator